MGNSSNSGESGPSYYSQAKEAYEQVVCAIIRPPRCEYEMRNLGPTAFDFVGQKFRRTDLTLINSRGMAIRCSHWEPVVRSQAQLPCVVYLHGNASARLEALPLLSLVLSMGATLFSLDFCGSGQSDGEYVSLGAYEKDDLDAVIQHLRVPGHGTSTIALWGRSMGAATAIMYAVRDPSIAGMVLDSPFASLEQLAEELVEKGREQGVYAPSLLVSIAIRFIRSSVQDRAKFDIRELSPLKAAKSCFVPALFVAATGDTFIPPHHSSSLHDACVSDGKNLILVDGDHNSKRPVFMFDSVSIFLQAYLQIREEAMLPEGMQFAATQEMPWKHPYASRQGFSISSMFDMFSNSRNRDWGGGSQPIPADAPEVTALKNRAAAYGASGVTKGKGEEIGWGDGGDHDTSDYEDDDEHEHFRDLEYLPPAPAACVVSAKPPPPSYEHSAHPASPGKTAVKGNTRARTVGEASYDAGNAVDSSEDIGTGMDTEKQRAVENTVGRMFKSFGFGGGKTKKKEKAAAAATEGQKPAAGATATPAAIPATAAAAAAAIHPAPAQAPAPAPVTRKIKKVNKAHSSSAQGEGKEQEEVWSCPACTLFNGCENVVCVACEAPRTGGG